MTPSPSGYQIVSKYKIFNDSEFRDHFNVDMSRCGLKPNLRLPRNEEGVAEDVLCVRDKTEPRELVAISKIGVGKKDCLMPHLIREGQAEELFNYCVDMELKSRGFRSNKKSSMKSLDEVSSKAEAAIRQMETEQLQDETQQGSEDDEALQPRFKREVAMPVWMQGKAAVAGAKRAARQTSDKGIFNSPKRRRKSGGLLAAARDLSELNVGFTGLPSAQQPERRARSSTPQKGHGGLASPSAGPPAGHFDLHGVLRGNVPKTALNGAEASVSARE